MLLDIGILKISLYVANLILLSSRDITYRYQISGTTYRILRR